MLHPTNTLVTHIRLSRVHNVRIGIVTYIHTVVMLSFKKKSVLAITYLIFRIFVCVVCYARYV